MEPAPLRLGHVILFSPDPARQAKFYREALGMKLSDRVGDDMVVFLRGDCQGVEGEFLFRVGLALGTARGLLHELRFLKNLAGLFHALWSFMIERPS